MKKILVSIYVLKLDKMFDVELPINLAMKDVVNLLQESIKAMDDVYQIDENIRLYESDGGNLVNLNNIVKYSGIKNGSTLLLV